MPLTDADHAIAAASAGAAVVRSRFGARHTRVDKGSGDFATEADLAAERAILEVLRNACPGDAVTAEESGSLGSAAAQRRWLVDPLCGTLNYAADTMLASVNVALRTAGVVTAAAAADPFAGEVFWSDGGGARVRRDGTDEPLIPSAGSRLVEVNLDPPFPNAAAFRTVHLLADPAFGQRFRPRVVSTTLAVAWVAAGRRAAYLSDGDLRDSVHFAAGIALCQAAGCTVTDLFGRAWPADPGGGLLVAADGATHARLLDLVALASRP
jgi:myo-inositol-1(or 4)-monophosphatase